MRNIPVSIRSPTKSLVMPHMTMVVLGLGGWPVALCNSCITAVRQCPQLLSVDGAPVAEKGANMRTFFMLILFSDERRKASYRSSWSSVSNLSTSLHNNRCVAGWGATTCERTCQEPNDSAHWFLLCRSFFLSSRLSASGAARTTMMLPSPPGGSACCASAATAGPGSCALPPSSACPLPDASRPAAAKMGFTGVDLALHCARRRPVAYRLFLHLRLRLLPTARVRALPQDRGPSHRPPLLCCFQVYAAGLGLVWHRVEINS